MSFASVVAPCVRSAPGLPIPVRIGSSERKGRDLESVRAAGGAVCTGLHPGPAGGALDVVPVHRGTNRADCLCRRLRSGAGTRPWRLRAGRRASILICVILRAARWLICSRLPAPERERARLVPTACPSADGCGEWPGGREAPEGWWSASRRSRERPEDATQVQASAYRPSTGLVWAGTPGAWWLRSTRPAGALHWIGDCCVPLSSDTTRPGRSRVAPQRTSMGSGVGRARGRRRVPPLRQRRITRWGRPARSATAFPGCGASGR